ncbi:MAG: hypothetical protein HFJ72_08345 [Adlercreutzia sp.]|nr:hypothetical protein [Adlercreutzia sp.]
MPVIDATRAFNPGNKTYLKIEVPIRRGVFRRKSVLYLKPPTKTVYEGLMEAAAIVDEAASGGSEDSLLTKCYGPVAAAMSNNRDRVAISEEDLDAAGFDMADIGEFLALYTLFMGALTEAKN